MEKLSFSILRTLPGFRFNPTDEELVVHYLKPKIQSLPLPYPIPEADVCGSDPWNLPGDSEQERYFFSMVRTKHPNGIRYDRTTPSGYWRPSGLDRKVFDSRNNNQVGTKKYLVFYMSKPSNGTKTNWIMHEYKITNPIQGMQSWTICRVFLKKRVRNDEAMVQVPNSDPRNFDLNLDGGGSSSSGSSGVTVAGEDEEYSK